MFNRYGRFPELPFWAKVGEIPTSYKVAMSYEEQLLWLCHEIENIKNSSGNYNYELLNNKPSINGIELLGNKSLNALGIQPRLEAGTGIVINGNVISATGGGGGGTDDYTDLENKPQINGVTLIGNKTFQDLGLNFPTKTVWNEPSDYPNVDIDTNLLFDLTETDIGEAIPNWTSTSNTKVYCMKFKDLPSTSFRVSGRCSNVMWAVIDGYPYFSIGDHILVDKSEANLQYSYDIIDINFSTLVDTSEYYILFQFTDVAFDTPILEVASQEIDFGTDYNNLDNKPTINGVTLQGDLTSSDLHIEGATVTVLTSNLNLEEGQPISLPAGFYNTGAYKVRYLTLFDSEDWIGNYEIFYVANSTTIISDNYNIVLIDDGVTVDWSFDTHSGITNSVVNDKNMIPTSQAVYQAIQNISPSGSSFYTEIDSNITLNADGTITPTLEEGYYFLKSPHSITYYDNDTSATTFVFTDSIFYYDGENTIKRTGINTRSTNQIETKLIYSSGTNSWELYEIDDSNFVNNTTGNSSYLRTSISETGNDNDVANINALRTALADKINTSSIATTISSSSTDSQVASAKAVYDNSLQVYSTSEKRVGTWTDGKPLYEKTFSGTTPTVTTDGTSVNTSLDIIDENADVCFIVNSFIAYQNQYNSVWTCPYTSSSGRTIKTQIAIGGGYKRVQINSDGTVYNNSTCVAVVRYTKSTD